MSAPLSYTSRIASKWSCRSARSQTKRLCGRSMVMPSGAVDVVDLCYASAQHCCAFDAQKHSMHRRMLIATALQQTPFSSIFCHILFIK